MLTRLQIKGFKNLREVDLHFGPFTCIAGRNGVGKPICSMPSPS
jgi:AAA15 family ATPase/GTPase